MTTQDVYSSDPYQDDEKTSFPARVRGATGQELNYVNDVFFGPIASIIPFVNPMSNPFPGTSQTQRVGNWIKPVSLSGRVLMTAPEEGVPVNMTALAFIVLFHNDLTDHPPLASQDFLLVPTRPSSPWNVLRKDQFTVVWSQFFNLVSDKASPYFNQEAAFRIDLEEAPQITFDGDDLKKNHLLFCATSSSDGAPATVQCDFLFRYSDS